MVAAETPRWYSFISDIFRPGRRDPTVGDQVEWALGIIGIGHLADALPSDLSHGQRKLVSVSRALAARPKLVLLDEPAAGLDTSESQVLGGHLRDFLTRDITVFLIDHDMGLVLNVCDYIYVLDFGRIIAEGTPSDVRSNPVVIQAYLGESAGEEQAREGTSIGRSQRHDGDGAARVEVATGTDTVGEAGQL
jgi:branched-chain amino acid transport system ATP-binding protein